MIMEEVRMYVRIGALPGVKQLERWADDPPPCTTEVRRVVLHLCSQSVLMARQREKFNFVEIFIKTQTVILRHIIAYVKIILQAQRNTNITIAFYIASW